ncbi:MAG: hypothetical protein VX731_04045, partial [Candidatus Neomarinimicrobiota bacterium]|nr:hypothetical protein [Candidatus Neomarinimicrobiota bacterium]
RVIRGNEIIFRDGIYLVDKINSRKVKNALREAPGVAMDLGSYIAIEAIKTVAMSAIALLLLALAISLGQ